MDGAVDYYPHSIAEEAKFRGVIWTAPDSSLVENHYTQTGTRTTNGR